MLTIILSNYQKFPVPLKTHKVCNSVLEASKWTKESHGELYGESHINVSFFSVNKKKNNNNKTSRLAAINKQGDATIHQWDY